MTIQRPIRLFILVAGLFFVSFGTRPTWGFWAHKRINRVAVFRLPPEMQVLYKSHIEFITENAVNPDKRRYAVIGEAERHFIDLDAYGDSALVVLPKSWKGAVTRFGEDSLRRHGIAPWYISTAAYQLTEAFRHKDQKRILRISTEIGHYIADIHVPLHTTKNYNGQMSGQEGIHGFWESRLPELFAENYNLWVGKASYIKSIQEEVWRTVDTSHAMCDSVFLLEKMLTREMKPEQKYSYELRNNILTKTYSAEFSAAYHAVLRGQVESRMKRAIAMVGDVWYTCWVDAGQPDLKNLGHGETETDKNEESVEQASWLQRILHVRPESDD